VDDSQYEGVLLVPFERDQIWKTLESRLADRRGRCACSRPCRIRIGSFANSLDRSRNLGDEFAAQARRSFIVPKRGTAKLSTRFRMQFDPHAAARVPSRSSAGARPSLSQRARSVRRTMLTRPPTTPLIDPAIAPMLRLSPRVVKTVIEGRLRLPDGHDNAHNRTRSIRRLISRRTRLLNTEPT
jgi:hypothetical protein